MDKRWTALLALLAALCVGAAPCSEAPSAPSFPYRLTAVEEARVEGGGPGALFARLERQDLTLWVEIGAVLDGLYRVDRVDVFEIEVTHLDLDRALVVPFEEVAAEAAPVAQPEIVVAWSGEPLPSEALEPPEGTVVLVELASAGGDGTATTLQAAEAASGTVLEIACRAGPVLPAALDAPEGTIVEVYVLPEDGSGGEGDCPLITSTAAANELVIPFSPGGLPPEAENPPEGTVVKLLAPEFL